MSLLIDQVYIRGVKNEIIGDSRVILELLR